MLPLRTALLRTEYFVRAPYRASTLFQFNLFEFNFNLYFKMSSSRISVRSLNTKSVRGDYKWVQMECFLRDYSPDVCLLQETNITKLPQNISPHIRYNFFLNEATDNYSGTGIAVRVNNNVNVISGEIIHPEHCSKGVA